MARAKLFICHHPGSLLMYKNLAEIVKKHNKDVRVILFKVNHPYFEEFDFEPYKEYFDEIVELGFIGYNKNFLKGWWKIFKFQEKLKKTISQLLLRFQEIDLFLGDSAWLPINVLLYHLSKEKNIKNITRLVLTQPESSQTKTDKMKTFLSNLYSLPFNCYKVKAISTLEGRFMDFVYEDNVAGDLVKITSPVNKENINNKNVLPYPFDFDFSSKEKKDMVIIFGDNSIPYFYSQYLPSGQEFVKRLSVFFKVLESKYPNCRLCYKPHPSDEDKIMPGIDIKKYKLFDNGVNAQVLFDKYRERIKAVYTCFSTSVVSASFLGISSYTFYRYMFNQPGIEKFDTFFDKDNIKSQFLFHISNLEEIGKIDDSKGRNIDFKKLEEKYRKVLCI